MASGTPVSAAAGAPDGVAVGDPFGRPRKGVLVAVATAVGLAAGVPLATGAVDRGPSGTPSADGSRRMTAQAAARLDEVLSAGS